MATMDTIKHHGGDPANFLDVGGSATEEAVTEAFSIILSDEKVNGILVNIFGGIMDCEVIAKGVVNAATNFKNDDGSTGFKVPLVVRLEGNNVEAGLATLEAAAENLPTLQAASDLNDGAKKVVRRLGITAFGQAVAYKLFAHRVYIVMPKSTSQKDISRLSSLCLQQSIGLVTFDETNFDDPDFQHIIRAQKTEPDAFYTNEFLSGLNRDIVNRIL
jgi:hypothetical protein